VKHQRIAAICLWLGLASAAAAQPLPPLPSVPTLDEQPAETAPVTSPLQLPLPEMPASGMVFAPLPGKSPRGQFDSPWNTFYGDGRINRALVLGRAWIEMEYLAWASKPTQLPALVSTSPLGTDPAGAGILGPDGSVLFGGTQTQHDLRSGARLNFGYWF